MKKKTPEIIGDKITQDPQKAFKLLSTISGIVQTLNKKNSRFNSRLEQILTIILDYLGVEQGSIMVLERRKLVVRAATRRDLVGIKQSLDTESIAAWVAKNKSPIFIPDISKDARFKGRGSKTYRKNALLTVPILQGSKLLGVVNVTDKSGDKDLLQEDITYLMEFGAFILSSLVQQQLQDKLKRQQETLRRRNKELHRQEQLREELSGMLIHDLKAPLSEIVANLDILSYSISGDNQEFLEAAQLSCDRTVRMVSNLVTINQIEDGNMKLFTEETEIAPLLKESYSAMKGLAKIKNIKLTLQLSDEELPTLHLDRIIILRVLQNLLVNAMGYTTPGTEITLGCSTNQEKNFLEFYVEDQGPGIALDKQESIFNKYARISDKQDTLIGTGLGLYFCKLSIEIHKGKIGIFSSPGNGCRFFFTLPL